MKVLVCGGRHFSDRVFAYQILDEAHKAVGFYSLMTGAAQGADRIALDWAHRNGVSSWQIPAEWEKYGKAAGPIRNQKMLDVGKPDLVIAFPGGKGTTHMVKIARAAGVEVREITAPGFPTPASPTPPQQSAR